MILKIILISIVLIALAGVALGIKYYKNKKAPVCGFANEKNEGNCSVCGVEDVDVKCEKEN